MKGPNFFISGAPRCGTTALYTYLSEHPNIFMSDVKELNYFADDFPNVQKIAFRSQDDYLKVFARVGEEHLAVGEASPFYLFSKVAFENMKTFKPDAKVILSLRNPVDFTQSYHRLNLSLLREDEPDLAKAWDLQDQRKRGQRIPISAREPSLLFYGEVGCFGNHVEKLFTYFPKEQVKIILFDDIVADTKTIYDTLLEFLKVPIDGRVDFPRINANFVNRSRFLAWIFHPPQPVYRFFMRGISIFGVNFMEKISVIYNRLERLNTVPTSRTAMDPELRKRLAHHFRSDIDKLSGLIDRDLSHWFIDG